MTTTAPAAVRESDVVHVSPKNPVTLTVATVLVGLLTIAGAREGDSTLRLAQAGDLIALPDIVLPAMGTGVVATILLAVLTGYAWLRYRTNARVPMWVSVVFAFIAVLAFLVWASAGAAIPITGLLFGSLGLAVPLVFGALGGVISEKSGVVNIAIEGQLLLGAFSSAVVASITGSVYAGLLAAMVGGVLVSFMLAAFAIKYYVEQVIVGVVLNVLVVGLTGFLFSQVLAPNAATLNSPPRFDRIDIPLLSGIPIIGPVLFRQTLIVYIMYIVVFVVAFAMYRTKWGLRVRAVGEHPRAADTVGINVRRTRFWNVALAGAIAGIGGAYFTLGSAGLFGKEMTAGAGYIALAAVIFGRWDPLRATLAALLFGFASNLKNVLGIIGSPVPSEFLLMLPYVVTLLAVAGFVGHVRAPAADGQPYYKD